MGKSVIGLAMMLYGFWLLYATFGFKTVALGAQILLIYRGYELLGLSKD